MIEEGRQSQQPVHGRRVERALELAAGPPLAAARGDAGHAGTHHHARPLQAEHPHNDHAADVRIKSTSYDALLIACPHATFTGTADVNGVSKKYQVDVDDMDEPGSSPGVGPDTFTIRVLDDTYMATGPLVGGNIQVHKPPECG